MRKFVAVFAVIFLCVQAAGLSDFDPSSYSEQKINKAMPELPDFLASLVGDQKINVNLRLENSTSNFSIDMDGTNISEIRDKEFRNPSLEVWTSQSQLSEISNSSQPVQTLNSAFKNGSIRYESYGVVNQARFFIAEQFVSLGSLF